MAKIVLCRVDSRLIHGQVITKWVNQTNADRIIVVSEMLKKDPFMLNIYMMAAPPNIKIDVFDNENITSEWVKNKLGRGNIIVLFGDLKSTLKAIQDGFEIDTLQIGGLGGGPNRKVVYQNITLDDDDIVILKELEKRNVNIIFQTIPEDKPLPLEEVYIKYKKFKKGVNL